MEIKQIQAETEYLWENYSEVFPALIRFDAPKIILNNRFTSTAGVCKVELNVIELGSKFFAAGYVRQMMGIILPHEIAHQIDFNLNGLPKNNRWHGSTWVEIMVKLGQSPDRCHTMNIKGKR